MINKPCPCDRYPDHAVLPAIVTVWATYEPHTYRIDEMMFSVFVGFPAPVVSVGDVLPTDEGTWFFARHALPGGVSEDYATADAAITALVTTHANYAEHKLTMALRKAVA